MAREFNRVLLVEDSEDTSGIVSFLLQQAGYQVTAAQTIAQARELASLQPYEIYVLDQVLPDGPGTELCLQLRESHPTVPVVFFSGRAAAADREAALAAGAVAYLVKPDDIMQVVDTVTRLLEERRIEAIRTSEDALLSLSSGVDPHLTQVVQQFVELFRGLPVACFLYDREGCVLQWNRACEGLYGVSAAAASGHVVTSIIRGSEGSAALAGLVDRVLAGETLEGQELAILRPDGSRRDLLCNMFPFYGTPRHPMGGISASMDITERKQQEQQLREVVERLHSLAMTDGLTGLKNHRALHERLGEEFQRALRYDTPLSLILSDVDKFKSYNDSFGHPAGNEALQLVARLLQVTARDTDIVARYGGEEFALLLPNTDASPALISAERHRGAIEQAEWPHRPLTASFGVSTVLPGMNDAAHLLEAADRALYASKAGGGNLVTAAMDLAA